MKAVSTGGSAGKNGEVKLTTFAAGAVSLLLMAVAVLDESQALWTALFPWLWDIAIYAIGVILACFAFLRFLRLYPFEGWNISRLAQLLVFLVIVGVPGFLLGYFLP